MIQNLYPIDRCIVAHPHLQMIFKHMSMPGTLLLLNQGEELMNMESKCDLIKINRV